ncbi:MAG: hypothetical protein ABI567_11425 [Gammaproteobacteria bacterium]
MSNLMWATLGVAMGLLGPLLYLRMRRLPADADEPARSAPVPHRGQAVPDDALTGTGPVAARGNLKRQLARKFHGVTVKTGPRPCAAVQALAGQRFLPEEAPQMPLAGCDQASCQCGYAHHRDRRDQEDRRSGWGTFGGFAPSLPGGNRRAPRQERRRASREA